VDWWAFGILAFEMINGDAPFRHGTPSVLFEKIVRDDPVFNDKFSPEAVDMISHLLMKDPKQRLGCGKRGIKEIQKHAFFKGINWKSILNKTAKMPLPPHRASDVTAESSIARAAAKTREAREELMPDSPVAVASSPSSNKYFERFSYQGGMDGASPNIDIPSFKTSPPIPEDEIRLDGIDKLEI
jgi:serine/threonine protein kinase